MSAELRRHAGLSTAVDVRAHHLARAFVNRCTYSISTWLTRATVLLIVLCGSLDAASAADATGLVNPPHGNDYRVAVRSGTGSAGGAKAGAAPATPAVAAPVAAPAECKAIRTEGLRTVLTQVDGVIRKSPAMALESLKTAEINLNCLEDTPPADVLRDLFRHRGIAHFLMKNRVAAQDAFYEAAALDTSFECESQLAGFSNPATTREMTTLCEKAVQEAADTEIRVRLINIKGAEAIFVDGTDKSSRDEYISLRLIAGFHLIQVKSAGVLRSLWTQISIPEGEDARFREIDLRKQKLITVVEQQVPVGILRLEGLETGSEVMVDGRTRRDLPVLRNVEVGERHLLIRSPDGSVMGVTVTIKANEETVYKASVSSVGGGGGGLKKIASLASLGVGALSLVGSGVTLGLSAREFGLAQTSYDAYAAASGAADYNTLWADVETHLNGGSSLRTTGLVLGGVGVLATGAGTFLLLTGEDGLAYAQPHGPGWKPYFAPLASSDGKRAIWGFGVQGRF